MSSLDHRFRPITYAAAMADAAYAQTQITFSVVSPVANVIRYSGAMPTIAAPADFLPAMSPTHNPLTMAEQPCTPNITGT